MKVQVVLVAAGSGTRLKAAKPKALVLLKGKPLVWYSLKAFETSKLITGVIVVGHPDHVHPAHDLCAKLRHSQHCAQRCRLDGRCGNCA